MPRNHWSDRVRPAAWTMAAHEACLNRDGRKWTPAIEPTQARCSECGMRIRGENHAEGTHHKAKGR
jgi:hypothetical protein